MIGQKKSTVFEWVTVFGLSGLAVVVSELIGLKQLWEDGIIYTVMLFTVIVLALKPAWRRKSFWKSLALILAGHLIALVALLQTLPPRRFGIPKLLLFPAAVLEGTFIIAALWKRMKAFGNSGREAAP